jgi:ribonucleotide reductase beta subunit family protein with ferritin-like domain
MEGIFFSGSFCSIFWIRERGLLPGLTVSNDFIARDEGQHVEGAIAIYNLLLQKPSAEIVYEIFDSAVKLEIEFITEALPCKLIGMNATMMQEYIKYVANRLLKSLEYEPLYKNVNQPFTFMDRIGLSAKSNFFELRPTQYAKAKVEEEKDPYANL